MRNIKLNTHISMRTVENYLQIDIFVSAIKTFEVLKHQVFKMGNRITNVALMFKNIVI